MSGITNPLSGKFFQGPFLLANTLRSGQLGAADTAAVLTELGALNRTSGEKSLDLEKAITLYHNATMEVRQGALIAIADILERDAIKLAPLVAQTSKRFLGTVRFTSLPQLQAALHEVMGIKTEASLLAELAALEKKFSGGNKIENDFFCYQAFHSIVYSLAGADLGEKAVPVFEQLIATASKIENVYHRSWAFQGIAFALAEAGLGEKAVPVFEQLIAAAEKIENTYHRSWAFQGIKSALVKTGLKGRVRSLSSY